MRDGRARAPRASIVHSAPGRMRVHVNLPSRSRQDGVLEAMRGLEDRPGVTSVETDSRTGSALVRFDKDELTPDDVVDLMHQAHEVLSDALPPGVASTLDRSASAVASGVLSTLSSANGRVYRATAGALDLRMLVPVGLAGLAVRQLARGGLGIDAMPWYVLAYYSFDTFIKLHGEPAARQTHTTA